MHLTSTELEDLACFFAKRLTTSLDPADDADVEGWRAKLEGAASNGTLDVVAQGVARALPNDVHAQHAADLLTTPARTGIGSYALGATVLVGAAAMVLLSITVGAVGLGLAVAEAHQAQRTEPELQPELMGSARVASSTGDEPQDAPLVAPDEPSSVETTSVPREEDGPPGEPTRSRPSKCTTDAGGLVGYWYAGRTKPGSELTMSRMVNVRADYPNKSNRWSSGATIRCVLTPGDVIRPSSPPIAIDGGHYWVPMHSGDVIATRPPQEVATR